MSNLVSRARIRGEQAGKLPGLPTYKGHKDVTGIIRDMVPVHSVLTMKEFLRKLSAVGYMLSTSFASPVLD